MSDPNATTGINKVLSQLSVAGPGNDNGSLGAYARTP